MRLKSAVATVSLVVVATVAFAPTPAVSEVLFGYDRAGDIRYIIVPDEDPNVPDDGVYEGDPAPQRQNGDIIRTRISHAATKVRVSVQYRALTPGGLEHRHQLYIGSDRGRFTLNKVPEPGNWAGSHGVVLGYGDTPLPHARATAEGPEPYRCPGLYVRVDYANDRFLAEVPRACLGNPKWIKVRFITQILVDTSEGFRIYEDRAFSDGDAAPAALSPKILPTFNHSVAVP